MVDGARLVVLNAVVSVEKLHLTRLVFAVSAGKDLVGVAELVTPEMRQSQRGETALVAP